MSEHKKCVESVKLTLRNSVSFAELNVIEHSCGHFSVEIRDDVNEVSVTILESEDTLEMALRGACCVLGQLADQCHEIDMLFSEKQKTAPVVTNDSETN